MADERIISVRLRALTADLESGMRRAGASIRGFQAAADRDMQALGNTLRNAGRSMTLGLTVPIAAGFAFAIQQSISFESAMAGVAKTLDLSASETEAMADGIRAMAMELPASREEIAAVAEAAGQLGIQRENILEFTRTMIDLGESTNLTADQAATMLAQFANITGLPQDQFDNLGSAIVELGNNGASTEADIVALGQRLAAAGTAAGLTEAEIMGLAASMANVGLEAELGGTAMSQVLNRMRDAAIDGGPALEAFAAAAGMTGQAFARMFQADPTAAISAFLQGLQGIVESGGSVTPILEGIGLTGSRIGDVLRRLAGDAGAVSGNFDMANDAFLQNTALAEEAARRYATTGSQIQISWNQITDAAMSAGDILAPVLASIAGGAADLAGVFSNLPGPIQGVAIALAGITATVGPALWAIGAMASNWTTLKTVLPSVATAITSVGSSIRGAIAAFAAAHPEIAALIAAFAALSYAASQGFGAPQLELDVAGLVQQMQLAGDAAQGLANYLQMDFPDGWATAFADAGVSLDDFVEAALAGGDAWQSMIDRLNAAGIPTGELEWFTQLVSQASGEYQHLVDIGAVDPFDGVATGAAGAAGAIDDLNQEIDEYLNQTLGVEEARDNLQGSFQSLFESLLENGTAWRGNSTAALENRAALREVVNGFGDVITSMDAAGAGQNQMATATQNVIDRLREARDDGILTADAFEHYRDIILGIHPANLRADGSQARQEAGTTSDHINRALSRQFRAFLRADGNPARSEASRTAQALIAATNRRYEALLRANNIQALNEIEEARRAARAMADANYTAHINIVTTNNADVPGLTHATGGYIRHRPGGRLVLAGEGGYDEATITSDPRYRARQLALLARLGFGQFAQPYAGLGTGATVGGGGTRVEYNFVVVRDTREAVAAVPSARREHARAFLDGRAG